jgi:hypothetical protein
MNSQHLWHDEAPSVPAHSTFVELNLLLGLLIQSITGLNTQMEFSSSHAVGRIFQRPKQQAGIRIVIKRGAQTDMQEIESKRLRQAGLTGATDFIEVANLEFRDGAGVVDGIQHGSWLIGHGITEDRLTLHIEAMLLLRQR